MAEEQVALEAEQEELTGSRPSTDANIVIQLLVGLIGAIGIAFAVFPLRDHPVGFVAYIYSIINDRGPVQYVELFMAFMVAALVFLKTRIVRNQLNSVVEAPVDPDIDLSNDDEIMELRRRIHEDESLEWSILLTRIDRLLALWLGSKDISRVASWAAAESERDMSASDSSYAIGRTLIWAIPILGFIGTVMGLGGAVASFTDVLGEAAGLEQIREGIAGVTRGLGVAFDTTLLALILSVVLMFPLSAIQRREENLFVEIDNYLDDTLISRFPSPEQQPIVIENLEDSIEAAFRRYIPDPDRYEEVFSNAIERAASSVEKRFGELSKGYESTLNELTARMTSSMATVGDSLEAAMRKIVDDVREEDSQMLERRKQAAEEEVRQFREVSEELYESARKVAEDYRSGVDALRETTRETSEQSLSAARELGSRMEQVVKLASTIEDLLHIEESMRKGIEGIATSAEFQQTMQELRSHLVNTDEFCKRLSKPRVITLREEIS